MKEIQHVFIIGSKGMGNYGGYETFVDKLTEYHMNDDSIKYHVAWKAKDNKEFERNNARCFNIKVPNIGPAQAIYYDIAAFKNCYKYIKKNKIQHPIVYILACRIGPFMKYYVKKIHKLGGKVYVNPDGHEWMRAKWSAPVRKYWKLSEQLMVKYSDLLICDSINIEKYIKETYKKYDPNTTYIAYGAETRKSNKKDNDEKIINWYKDNELRKKEYYLVVGRFVPENNYEIMIKEFIKSNTTKDLVIITNVNDKFLSELENKLQYKNDKRIKFVGTVYDKELLMKIRENAYGYFHGHEVGGTNPSLLEALGSTDLNLLLDVGFNREVAKDSAFYWTKDENNLANLIDECDNLSNKRISELGKKSTQRIKDNYSWIYISNQYLNLFKKNNKKNNDLISIIIPVYNTKKEILDRCIYSAINQDYTNIEVIIVNDGSKEEIRRICNNYTKIDKRIRIINKDNGGVSSARNIGIESSNGKYILFVDSDDYIDDTYVKELYDASIENSADVAFSSYKKIYTKKIVFQKIFSKKKKLLKDKNNNQFNEYNLNLMGTVWGKLYRKETIKEARFNLNIHNGEDVVFNYNVFNDKLRYIYIPNFGYNYTINTNSAVRKYNKNMVDEYKKTISIMNEIVTGDDNANRKNSYYLWIYTFYRMIIMNYYFNKDNTEKYKIKIQQIKKMRIEPPFNDFFILANPKDLIFSRKMIFYILKHNRFLLFNFVVKFRG